MREGLEKASLDMNLGGDIGFRSITRNYDVGALKSHTPCSVTPSFKRVIEEEISSTQYFMNQRGLGYPSLQDYSPFDAERINYARELLKSINTEGSQRDYPIVSRMMRMYDANNTERRRLGYMDAVSIGVTDLLATDRLDSLTLNAFECRDKSGKTISCMQKLIEVSRDLNNTRKNPRKQMKAIGYRDEYSSQAIGYRDEYSSLFAIKDMYKSNMCDAADGSGKRSCLEFVFEKMMNDGTQVPMDVYIAIMSNRDFTKYADTVINVGSGNIALRDVVCQNVKLFDLGDYLVKTKTLGNVGNNRPRFDNLAANLHSMCKGCDKIKDPLDKRLCMDADLFDENGGFLAGKEMNHTSVNEKGQSYGGYSYNYSRWANDYAKDPEASMSHFRYRGSDDIFGLAGVYRVTYDPSKLGLAVNVDRFDYESVVRELVFPAIERTVGKRLSRFKKYHDVQIETYTLDRDDPTNYKISVYFTHRDESGNQHDAVETYNIPEMFSKGGLISSDDMKKTVIRTKDIADSIRRISTMKSSESKDNVLTMTISNRPSDFMRASTGQPWTSCMGFRQFPGLGGLNRALLTKMNLGSYIAFVSGDDLDGGWKARMILVPSMEHPMEVVNGSPTNMFRIEEPYGLPQFTAVMQAALRIIMRENGYNAPGSYSREAHGGRQIEEYIYNSSNPNNFADSVTRRGGSYGDQGTGSRGGRRRAALMEELWDESLSKCIEKVASGTAFSVGSRSFKKEEDCGFFLDEKISKHEMSSAYVKTLFSKGLLSKDLERNYRHTVGNDEDGDSYFFFGYDGILDPTHVITTVDDKSLEYSKKLVSVEKIKPLTTVRGRGVPV
jgi:hypothetical protein